MTLWFYSFILWLYIVARIIIDDVRLNSLFLDYIPFLTFINLGIISFLSSMVFMYMYLKEDQRTIGECPVKQEFS